MDAWLDTVPLWLILHTAAYSLMLALRVVPVVAHSDLHGRKQSAAACPQPEPGADGFASTPRPPSAAIVRSMPVSIGATPLGVSVSVPEP